MKGKKKKKSSMCMGKAPPVSQVEEKQMEA